MAKIMMVLALAIDEAVKRLAVIHLNDALALIEDDMTVHRGAIYEVRPYNEEKLEEWVAQES